MSKVTEIFPANDFDNVMDKAKENYSAAIIIGYDESGHLDVRGGGMIDGKQPVMKDWLFMIESFKHKLLKGDYCED